uniref:Ribosomal protein L6 n=1 Tax=Pleurosigma intermedium TaxID=197753 RepID=A0A8F9R460_9STRA|nr:ribosomal protein L6 [Pleurosigma sp. mgcode 4]
MNNIKIPKKYTIKIPKDISIIYCNKKKIITLFGPKSYKSLKLKVHLFINDEDKKIKVSSLPFSELSNNEKKKIKAIQGTTVALLKQILIETSTILYKKLKLVGVSYRALLEESFDNKLLLLKLGFSHLIYFRISKKFKLFCKKRTQLFVSSNSYQDVTNISALIRNLKTPEPYKGKGILYENEKINIKTGKKI